jgi:tetratricopeptide (TPR) repeat protein
MKMLKGAAICFLVLTSLGRAAIAPSQSELEAMLNQAARELDANHFEAAEQELDAIDARQPDLAPTQNLRGLVLMRQGKYREAEAALGRAREIEPDFWDASFNLAEVPFLQKNWTEARHRFEALLAGRSDQMPGATNQLIRYKILLTFVLEGQEKKAESIVDEFKLSNDTPAFYYLKAALALQHGKQKEAKEWIATADQKFSSQLNELFAESFYEVGWLRRPSGAKPAALEITSTEERVARVRGEAQRDLQKAERALQQRDFDGALQWLDRADADAPGSAVSYNLRGKILLEQKRFEEAGTALGKALAVDPNFEEAQINLAQIPFKKKDYSAAREQLEALVRGRTAGAKNQTAQLIQYRIFMTLLLQGQESAAQKMMDQFKFTDQTPALYYAEAAWAFQHQNPKQGKDWITSANKLFSPSLNRAFADSLDDVVSFGGLTTPPAASPLAALGKATPSARALPTPASPSPAQVAVESLPTAPPTPAATPVPSPQATSSTPTPTPSPTASTASKKSGDAASKKQRHHRSKSTSAKRTAAHAKKTAGRKTVAPKPMPTSPPPTPTPEPSRPSFLTRAMRTLLSPINRRHQTSPESEPFSAAASPTPIPPKKNPQ